MTPPPLGGLEQGAPPAIDLGVPSGWMGAGAPPTLDVPPPPTGACFTGRSTAL